MIEFQQAGFNYGENAVLRELTLGLTPAGFHVLLGASGSGKTTLLRLCYLDLEPSAGRIGSVASRTTAATNSAMPVADPGRASRRGRTSTSVTAAASP